MVFDFASFAGGLVAGALVGILAGYFHETETIGELQERVRIAMLQFDRMASGPPNELSEEAARAEVHRRLLELQDEIRKMYRRPEV
jgi:hypothetical protein